MWKVPTSSRLQTTTNSRTKWNDTPYLHQDSFSKHFTAYRWKKLTNLVFHLNSQRCHPLYTLWTSHISTTPHDCAQPLPQSSQHITATALFQSIYLRNSMKRQLCCVSTLSGERKCLRQQNLAYSNSSRGTAAQPVRNALHLHTLSLSYIFDWSVPFT